MHAGAKRVLRRAVAGPGSAVSVVAALIFLAAWGCSSASSRQLARDELWRQKIVGSWAEGVSPYGVSTFLPGGVYRGVIYLSAERLVVLMTVEGWWRIEGGRLYSKAETIEMLQPLPMLSDPDKLYVDIIVDITDDAMRLIDETGTENESQRVRGEGEVL
ncbi:MAG TPA: hypothetical protein VKH64_16705 [Candidatus Binatia bacterium]|nr:hypothetical protein [Candidatus Binatia bacterium]